MSCERKHSDLKDAKRVFLATQVRVLQQAVTLTIDSSWNGGTHKRQQKVEAEESERRCFARAVQEVQEDEVREQGDGEELGGQAL